MKIIATAIRVFFLAFFLLLLENGKPALWLALFAASLLAALIFGRIYCGYICPMNTLMLPAAWLSKKMRLQTDKTPRWLASGRFAWVSLAASTAAMLLSRGLLHVDLPILPLWLVIAAAVTLRYRPEVFHNLICPFGALQKAFGRFARLSENVDASACIGCKLCERVCPSRAVAVSPEDQKAAVDPALCHQCGDCRRVCPEGAIGYRNI